MYVFGSARRGWREWRVDERIGFRLTNPVVTGGVLYACLGFGCGGVGGEWVGGLDQGLKEWGGVISV